MARVAQNNRDSETQKPKSRETKETEMFVLLDWLHKLYQFTGIPDGSSYSEAFDELEHRLNVKISESSGMDLGTVEIIHRKFHEERERKFLESSE